MVNYSQSKILNIGEKISSDTIFATTNSVQNFMREMRKKFACEKNEIVTVLVQKSVNNKVELNNLLNDTKKKYFVEPVISDGKDLKSITLKRYDANLKIVMKILKIYDVKYFIENAKETLDMIIKLKKADNTKKNYIKSIISILPKKTNKIVLDIYISGLSDLQEKINVIVNNQMKLENVDYKTAIQLNEITKDLIKKNELLDAVITIFYTGYYIPVCRLLEIYTLKISNYNIEKDNYIDFSNEKLVFNNYKTSHLYGKQFVKLHSSIIKLFQKLINTYTTKSDFLLQINGRPFYESDFSKKIKDIFGINLNLLRSMYFTDNYNKGFLHTEKQKINFAKKMRNSISVFKYYIKFDKNDDVEKYNNDNENKILSIKKIDFV